MNQDLQATLNVCLVAAGVLWLAAAKLSRHGRDNLLLEFKTRAAICNGAAWAVFCAVGLTCLGMNKSAPPVLAMLSIIGLAGVYANILLYARRRQLDSPTPLGKDRF